MRRPKRRPPVQRRARATVADILEAAARILEKRGASALTTNEVARVAGVGIGTLYQYFGSKEEIVEALQERHFAEMGRPFLAKMEELADAPLGEMVAGLANLMRTSDLLNSPLSKALLAFPSRARPKAVIHLEQRTAEILHAYLVRLSPRADPNASADPAKPGRRNDDRLRIPVFLVVQTVEALIISTSQHKPRGLSRQRFTEELGNIVMRYLAPLLA